MTDPALQTLWTHLLADWNDEKRHAAFLEYCQDTKCLVEAARHYRGVLEDGERAQLAERQLKRIALLAMSELEANRTTRSGARRQSVAWILVVFFLAASLALLWTSVSF